MVIGLESFNQNVLNYYGKGIRVEDNYRALNILDKLGIECVGSYIMFNPKSTFVEIKNDYYHFCSRLLIDKGVNLLNCILSTSTVLSIDEGTNMYEYNEMNNKIINDNYQIIDERVDKVKKAAIFITYCLANNILRLVRLDKYVRKMYKDSELYNYEMEKMDDLWYQLARTNLDVLGRFIRIYSECEDLMEVDVNVCHEIVEDLWREIDSNWEKIDEFEKEFAVLKDVFPRTWFYYYKSGEVYNVYDLAKEEWVKRDKLYVEILGEMNLIKEPVKIIKKLSRYKCYEEKDVISCFEEIKKRN